MTIKRIAITALATGVLLLSSFGIAFAESTSANWNVTFNSDKQMISDYDQQKINDAIDQMMPGDDLSLGISIKNECANSTDWYMTSNVFKTLEDANEASGGAYTYSLTFTNSTGEVSTIYSSERVGGDVARDENSQGLKEVSNATGSWMYVTTLTSGESGQVHLNLSLDGMTQENNYMRQEGGLEINFAVEDTVEGGTMVTTEEVGLLPKTGDLFTNGLLIAICALFAAATVYSYVCDRKKIQAVQDCSSQANLVSGKGGVK